MATKEFLRELLSCLWISVEPCLPPKRLYQLGIVDFPLTIMIQPLLILTSQNEYDYSQRVHIVFLLGFIL